MENAFDEALEEKIKLLEERLSIRRGFFYNLLNKGYKGKDDWAFIVKLHALVETAVSHYLTEKVGKLDLKAVFQDLPMSIYKIGKIAFLKALGLLEEHLKFMQLLSTIRNDYVHSVNNVDLKFQDYFKSNKNIFKTLVKEARVLYSIPTRGESEKVVQAIPVVLLWSLTMRLLIDVYEGVAERENFEAVLRMEKFEKLRKDILST